MDPSEQTSRDLRIFKAVLAVIALLLLGPYVLYAALLFLFPPTVDNEAVLARRGSHRVTVRRHSFRPNASLHLQKAELVFSHDDGAHEQTALRDHESSYPQEVGAMILGEDRLAAWHAIPLEQVTLCIERTRTDIVCVTVDERVDTATRCRALTESATLLQPMLQELERNTTVDAYVRQALATCRH